MHVITLYFPLLDVAYFQLKFSVISCDSTNQEVNIIVIKTAANNLLLQVSYGMEGNIIEALVYFTDRECRCGFIPSMIDKGEFHCSRHYINYRLTVKAACITGVASSLGTCEYC